MESARLPEELRRLIGRPDGDTPAGDEPTRDGQDRERKWLEQDSVFMRIRREGMRHQGVTVRNVTRSASESALYENRTMFGNYSVQLRRNKAVRDGFIGSSPSRSTPLVASGQRNGKSKSGDHPHLKMLKTIQLTMEESLRNTEECMEQVDLWDDAQEEFKMVISKTTGQKLGLSFSLEDGFTLKITAVSRDGLVQQWNENHPKLAVKPEDSIVEVNGTRTGAQHMLDEVRRNKTLELVVKRGQTLEEILEGAHATMAREQLKYVASAPLLGGDKPPTGRPASASAISGAGARAKPGPSGRAVSAGARRHRVGSPR
jgi:hypothetical protein